MVGDKLLTIAAFAVAPFCCGGLAIAGAGGFAALGAFALWQGFAAVAVVGVLAAATILFVRRRRRCEP